MTREVKLSLILGFAAVLAVAVLLSDHLADRPRIAASGVNPERSATASRPAEEPAEAPTLILVDEFGRPEPNQPVRPAPTTPQNSKPNRVQPVAVADAAPTTGGDETTLLDRLQQRFASGVGGAIDSLSAGKGPPAGVMLTEDVRASAEPVEMPTGAPRLAPNKAEADSAFRLYHVQEGDTLWSIASRHLGDGKRFKEIADLNRDRLGRDGMLRAGASIRLPASEGRASARNESKPVRPTETVGKADPTTYTVRAGDTLGKIASRLLGSSARYEDILLANKDTLHDEDSLSIGMVLAIPRR